MSVRRFLGVVLAGAVVTSALVAGVATAAVAVTDPNCAPVTMLAFRGSGETNVAPAVTATAGAAYAYGDSGLVTNGWEGPTLQRLIGQLAPDAVAAAIPVIGIGAPDAPYLPGYPAAAVDPTDLAALAASAQAGAVAAELLIKQTKTVAAMGSCEFAPRFIAVGYSQGALAARVLAQLNPVDVVGVVTLGDPAQKPNAVGNVGAGAAGDGLLHWLAPYFADKFDGLYAQNTATAAFCHAGDPVCEFGWSSMWRVATEAYENHAYFVSEADLVPATQAFQALAADARLNLAPAVTGIPVAHAAASVLAVAGAPTVISAVGSQLEGPFAAYTFDFGNGLVETNATGMAYVPVGVAGENSVAVTVTDGFRSDTTVLDYTVASMTAALPKTDLAAPNFLVATAPDPVAAGSTLPLVLRGAPTDSALTLLLVPAVSASPWGAEPAFATVLASESGVMVPADLAVGKYFVVVGAENGAWGVSTVDIVAATVDPGTDLPQTGGPLESVTPVTVPAVGQAVATVDGEADAVTVARTSARTGVTVTGTDYTLTVNGLHRGGSATKVDTDTVLVLERDGSVTVSGEGFAPNTDVQVYLFSTATAVGSAPVNSTGAFSKNFAVPASIAAGLHTLQVVGLAPDGSVRVLDLGVRVVDAAASASTLAKTGVDLGGVLGAALLVLLAGLAVTVLPRRRVVTAA